jgi:pyruvate kinase
VDHVRGVKLVCTIGPASIDRIDDLVATGMDVARVNFSHGSPATHEAAVTTVRAASAAAGRPVAVMVDLAGPKIRLGELRGGVAELRTGATFSLDPQSVEPGGPDRAGVTYDRLAEDVDIGDRVLLADGEVELRVTAADDVVEAEVVRGGTIRSRAGLAIPAERLSAPALTTQDIADLPRARALGVDLIAQSFVRRREDVVELRDRLGPDGPGIVAKIETRAAVDGFDRILDVADGVMVARGDLGVELPFEDVPVIQKELIRKALDRGVASIVATQMLESMTHSPRPTRAEASDVANAVFDGADAIMLSAETAIGAYPVLAAEAAIRIARACEARGAALLPAGMRSSSHARVGPLAAAAITLAEADRASAGIACFTRTGLTARILSSLRPRVPIFAFAPDTATVRRLALVHGVVPRPGRNPDADGDPITFLAGLLDDSGVAGSAGPVVLVASTDRPGTGPDVLAVHRPPAATA